MSRCFPYAPPAHARRGARGEAVSEPFKIKIKLRKEKGKYAITELGKDNRKEKRHRTKEEAINDEEVYIQRKRRNEDAESSGITEELEQPVSYLSDGSQSSKRRKLGQFVVCNGDGGKSSDDIIHVGLPSRKHNEPGVSIKGTARADPVPQHNEVTCAPQKASCSLDASEKKVNFACNSGSVDSLYEDLTGDWNWSSSSTHFLENIDDNQEWLFGRKSPQRRGEKKLNACDDVSCSASCNLWPRAGHLFGADVYALPYTVPF